LIREEWGESESQVLGIIIIIKKDGKRRKQKDLVWRRAIRPEAPKEKQHDEEKKQGIRYYSGIAISKKKKWDGRGVCYAQ